MDLGVILTLFLVFYTRLYINEIVIFTSYNFGQARFLYFCLHLLCIYLSCMYFSYQLEVSLMPVWISYLSLLLCLGFQKHGDANVFKIKNDHNYYHI